MKVAGVPLRVSPLFVAVAVFIGWRAASAVSQATLLKLPDPDDTRVWEDPEAFLAAATAHPSLAWVIGAGIAVALVYALSILAHELGHLLTARALGVGVARMQLDLVGGYVELEDPRRLTPGRHAAIVAAGPLVTGVLALAAFVALRVLVLDPDTSGALVAEEALSYALGLNLFALVINLLPFRPLDGGQLVATARLALAR